MSKSSKLTIGILAMSLASDYHRQIAGMTKHYMKLASHYGKVRMITPSQEPDEMKIDLLILPGGPDLSLALRKEEDSNAWIGQGKDQPYYTYFYKHSLQKWIDAGIPMFGICLGSQALANHFGADLITDIHSHQISDEHRALQVPNTDIGLTNDLISVNSRHHQAIAYQGFSKTPLKALVYGAQHSSDLLIPKGKSRTKQAEKLIYDIGEGKFEPGHIEAFCHQELPIAGVQWHPEDMLYNTTIHGDPTTHKIINWLLSARKPIVNAELAPLAVTADA
jgi:gamma-glutamyl-gamma-aminobutyrate hydrolase PuuD